MDRKGRKASAGERPKWFFRKTMLQLPTSKGDYGTIQREMFFRDSRIPIRAAAINVRFRTDSDPRAHLYFVALSSVATKNRRSKRERAPAVFYFMRRKRTWVRKHRQIFRFNRWRPCRQANAAILSADRVLQIIGLGREPESEIW